MSPTIPQSKSWKETNRLHKEQRKQWQEERLIKKVKKKEAVDEAEEGKQRQEGRLIKKVKKEEAEEELAKKAAKDEEQRCEKKEVSTVSIAVPASILDNAQSADLRSYLAGQIARAACIYQIDEIVVFDDKGEITEDEKKKVKKDESLGEGRDTCLLLARILQYLECPQYLRKYFFPRHKDLQYAGVLNPLHAPHHLRKQDVSLYREGAVTNKPIKVGNGSQVDVGFLNDIHIDKALTPGLRVTVKIAPNQSHPKKIKGIVVPPSVPRSDTGIYWGYTVRMAKNLTEVLTQSLYKDGYDLTIGTSDKGTHIDELESKSLSFHHVIIVFGGLSGIEAAVDVDPYLNVDDASLVFHKYLNTCPEQGSRTIRTEEAILISLAELRTKLAPNNPPLPNSQFGSFSNN